MRILLTKLKHIGDALLMTPTILAIRARYPDAEIVVVVRKGTEGILAGCPAIDRVLTAAAPEGSERSGLNWLEEARTIAELRRRKFDYAFELSDGDRGRWVCALARADVRCTNDSLIRLPRIWRLLFKSVSHFEWRYRHRVEKDFFTVMHALALGEGPGPLCFARERAVASWASERAGRGCTVFHPATRMVEKFWPEERWIELGRALKAGGSPIVVSVGPAAEEIALGERIVVGIGPEAFSTRGTLDWAQLAEVLFSARVFVGVDTAAMHLAAACQCPTVAIFGLSSVVQWKPWKVESRVLAGLGEMEEWPAEMVGVENPILRVTVQQAEAAAREIARDVSASAAQGSVPTPSDRRE
jgi:heptosyltransferase-3